MTLTKTRTTHDAFDWIVSLLKPAVADGSIYWISATSWAHDYLDIRPKAGRWLQAAIDNNSNEAYHLVLSCRCVGSQSLDEPEWLSVAVAKVWTLADASKYAGLILAAQADEELHLVVPRHTPAEKHQNWDGRP